SGATGVNGGAHNCLWPCSATPRRFLRRHGGHDCLRITFRIDSDPNPSASVVLSLLPGPPDLTCQDRVEIAHINRRERFRLKVIWLLDSSSSWESGAFSMALSQ